MDYNYDQIPPLFGSYSVYQVKIGIPNPLVKLLIEICLCRLGEAYGESGDEEKASEYFQEADSIYKVVPGIKHPFYLQDFQPLLSKYAD